jgi:hypothetical protein
MYDKDWEVHLALNDPLDPIHGYIEDYLEKENARNANPDEVPDLRSERTEKNRP